MALERGKLSNVVVVSAGSTVGIITVADSKKVYIRSILCHQPGATPSSAQVYFVPNGETVDVNNRIFDVDVNGGETVLLEPVYPLVIDTTGDTLQVGANTGTINVLVNGDKEV